jgi:hypothetical protein
MQFLILTLLVLVAGCAAQPVAKSMASGSRKQVIIAEGYAPAVLRGCEWTWEGYPGEVATFEVWSSLDLVNWSLATNTTEKAALFPEKPMEFYKVRARDDLGQVSDWASVPK